MSLTFCVHLIVLVIRHVSLITFNIHSTAQFNLEAYACHMFACEDCGLKTLGLVETFAYSPDYANYCFLSSSLLIATAFRLRTNAAKPQSRT